ncbi:MAG TPA: tetratricopeptide repeat protein [Candidatus Omnitrophota bacterium]|nr:tetratricopeptide repeat protein [Candidatus Omnitrophota bacterium]
MKIIISVISVFLLLCSSALASMGADVKKGNKLFSQGNYEASLQQYQKALEKDPHSPVIHFNTGAAHYKKGEYQAAIDGFEKALLSDDKILQGHAHYNLGNTFYRFGKTKEEKELPVAIQSLEKSLDQYQKAISLNKEDKEAAHNYEFVKKELERMKIKEQERKNQQQEKKDQEEKNDEQKQPSSSESSQKKEEEQQSSQSQDRKDQEQKESGQESEEKQDQQQDHKEKNAMSSVGQEQQQSEKQNQQSAGKEDGQQMSEQKAQMMLQQYQQQEEPKGILNFIPKNIRLREVEKDW